MSKRSLLVFLMLAACHKQKANEEKPAAPSAKSETSSETPTDNDKPAKKKEPPAKPPSQKAEPSKLAAYWKAMNDGRKATVAKKYEDAYAAFDKALVAVPDDAHAISERGYAKLLAKDFKGAVADLDDAAARTTDPKLLGQIYYNYGLAAEGQGDTAAARAAFARSNAYAPTPAAKKKLEGKSACTAVITEVQPATETMNFDAWKFAYEDARTYNEEIPTWVSEEKSLPGLCANPWKKGAPCIALLGKYAVTNGFVYVPTASGKIVRFETSLVGVRCGGNIEAKLVSDESDVAHVFWKAKWTVSTLVTEKNGEIVECGGNDTDCSSACGGEEVSYNDLFIAKDKGESMLFIGREAVKGADPLKVSVAMPVVTINGAGCNVERKLAK